LTVSRLALNIFASPERNIYEKSKNTNHMRGFVIRDRPDISEINPGIWSDGCVLTNAICGMYVGGSILV